MNKVFPYARIAGISLLVIMILQIALSLTKTSNPLLNILVGFLVDGLWIVLFTLLIRASTKRSPVLAPSWIGIAAFAMVFFSTCISSYGSSLIIAESDNWETIGNLFAVSNVMHYAYVACIAVAFIWLSKFFPKGSILKLMCFIIAIVPILLLVYNLAIHPWKWEDEHMRNTITTITSVLWPLLIFIPEAIFLFAFSKLKKS